MLRLLDINHKNKTRWEL